MKRKCLKSVVNNCVLFTKKEYPKSLSEYDCPKYEKLYNSSFHEVIDTR